MSVVVPRADPAAGSWIRAHAPFVVLMLVVTPWVFSFTWSDVIATVGDDSIAYIMLARHMFDADNVVNREWVAYQAHFPPLFPLVLGVTGGAWNFAVGHAVVASFAILSLILLYRYAALLLESNAGGFAITVLFLLTPTAWVSIRGILSEPMFLFVTLAALHYHERRLQEGTPRPRQWLIFGLLLGCALLLRSAGLMLIVAYAMNSVVRTLGRKERSAWPPFLPFAPAVAMSALWIAWRTAPEGFNYQSVMSTVMTALSTNPAAYLVRCAEGMFNGWIRSFNAASDVHWVSRTVFGAIALFGIAGSVLRARENRLDGWYVVVTLPILFVWLFTEDNMRRLLYPLVPILLIHAGVFALHIGRRVLPRRQGVPVLAGLIALPVLLCLPAWLLVQSKSLDREQVYPGFGYRYSDITEYYTTITVKGSRSIASRHAAVLSGLEMLRSVTPPGSKVMWVRPDYVAVLGDRQGIPWYFRWDRKRFLGEIQRSKADYLIVSSLVKTDMDGVLIDPVVTLEWALGFSQPVHSARNTVAGGYEVAVLEIDHGAVDRLLSAMSNGNPGRATK